MAYGKETECNQNIREIKTYLYKSDKFPCNKLISRGRIELKSYFCHRNSLSQEARKVICNNISAELSLCNQCINRTQRHRHDMNELYCFL